MIIEIIKAILLAGIPIAFFSYYLIKLTHQVKIDDKNKTKATTKKANVRQMVYKKYLKFGGGFYGVVAFITYFHVEFYQVVDFFKKFTNISDFIDRIGFSMIVNFFIEAIMNFITALIWPVYWPKFLPINSIAIWFIIAIIAHSMASKYALIKYENKEN